MTIRREVLEDSVLDGLKEHLMHPHCVKEFISEYYKEMNRLAATQDTDRDRWIRDLDKADREMKKLIQAIKDGVPGSVVKDEMQVLEERQKEMKHSLENAPASLPRLHPNLAQIYHDKVAKLTEALNDENSRTEAAEAIRTLIDEVRLVPDGGTLKIELFGQLAALIGLTNEHPRSNETGEQVTLVAGARKHLYRTTTKWRKSSALPTTPSTLPLSLPLPGRP